MDFDISSCENSIYQSKIHNGVGRRTGTGAGTETKAAAETEIGAGADMETGT